MAPDSRPQDPMPEDLAAWRQQVQEELSAPLTRRATEAEAVAAVGVVRALGVWPVHRDAVRGDRRRRRPWRLNKAAVRRVLHLAERLAKQPVARREVTVKDQITGEDRIVSRPIRYGGLVSTNVIKVLRALMWYLNRDGCAFPSYETLKKASNLGLNTVKRAMTYLRALNIVDWTQRCLGEVRDGVYRLVQTSNEYVIVPPEEWLGYHPRMERATPTPDVWGAGTRIEETDKNPRHPGHSPELEAVLQSFRRARDRGGG